MDEAKQMLNEAKENKLIDTLEDQSEWTAKVMESDIPVILDFYADWCAPCQKLTPLLENITNKFEGKFKLVKANIDALPSLANALKVQSIPHVFLIYKGQMVDSFVGIPADKRLGEFINAALTMEGLKTDENMAQGMLLEAEKFIEKGELDTADGLARELYTYDNWKEKYGGRVLLLRAYVAVKKGDTQAAFNYVAEFRQRIAERGEQEAVPEAYQKWMLEIDEVFKQKTEEHKMPDAKETELGKKIHENPSDITTMFELVQYWHEERKKHKEAI